MMKKFKIHKSIKNPLIICLIILFVILACAPLILNLMGIDADSVVGAPRLSPGQGPHLLGTDEIGRDLFARLLQGGRYTLGLGLIATILTFLIGALSGALAGFYGGRGERLALKVFDLLMAFPSLLVAVIVVAIIGPGMPSTLVAVGLVGLPSFFRISRALVLAEKNQEYAVAALSYGSSSMRILFLHILPNCLGPLIVQFTLSLSEAILNVSALGFLGLGVQPPIAEWGTMLSDARVYITLAPHLVTLPGLFLLVTLIGLNLSGDRLRENLDPRIKGLLS